MRLTSEIYISALLRRVNSTAGFGAVIRRGSDQAGAIYILCRNRLGISTIYGPAPQMLYSETKPDERYFVEIRTTEDAEEISDLVEKEAKFDPDLWVVEIEPGEVAVDELVEVVQTD